MQDFSGQLTHDEQQLQFLLKLWMNIDPNALKKTMIEDKASQ